MKSKIKKIIAVFNKAFPGLFIGLIVVLLPLAVSAQTRVLRNPLSADPDKPFVAVTQLIGTFIWAFLFIGGIIAVLNIINGGVKIATALGNEERLKQGKQAIMWSIIGLVVIFLGFIVLGVVVNRLTPAALPGLEEGSADVAEEAGSSIQGGSAPLGDPDDVGEAGQIRFFVE